MLAFNYYCILTLECIRAGSFCTPRLREELSQLSFHALYQRFDINPRDFWILASAIIKMLYNNVSHDYQIVAKQLAIIIKIPESRGAVSSPHN